MSQLFKKMYLTREFFKGGKIKLVHNFGENINTVSTFHKIPCVLTNPKRTACRNSFHPSLNNRGTLRMK